MREFRVTGSRLFPAPGDGRSGNLCSQGTGSSLLDGGGTIAMGISSALAERCDRAGERRGHDRYRGGGTFLSSPIVVLVSFLAFSPLYSQDSPDRGAPPDRLNGVGTAHRAKGKGPASSLSQNLPAQVVDGADGSRSERLPAAEGNQAGETTIPWVAGVSARGAAHALVTVIEFSDFECPFCGRVAPVVEELLKAYPNQIRFVFKPNPLPMHPHAELAHEAALAAGEQGKFWEMYDLLFAHQKQLERDNLIEYAKQLGLNLAAFQQALDNHRYAPLLEQNLAEARGLGVTSTPTFFINGRKLLGAQSLEAFKGVIDQALGLNSGPRREIAIGQAPVRGSPAAPVTVVEFSDFQCPFCARALPALQQLLAEYPDQVKWVFKNFPLDFHRDSALAHQAALAAGAQGKFWEMHDRVFAQQPALKRDDLIQTAKELGLEMTRFVADLDGGRFKSGVEADRAEGSRLGVNGTPTFFINGRESVGVASLAEFKGRVEAELQAAGVKLLEPQAKKAEGEGSGVGSTKGPAEAPITLVWYSDLQSPLSLKAAEVVRQVMSAYPGKIRLVFKNRPLEFHAEAVLAHEAALAAGAQGKFWEMHDLILANQKALGREDLIGYAARLGLEGDKFVSALDGQTYRASIDNDLAEARKLGVLGVPVFFVNGKRVDGVQTLAQFKEIVEAQLRQVQVAAAVH